jgi:hypothetical protein
LNDNKESFDICRFRQVVGQKKWWFVPPSETPYLKPAINVNGFSAYTLTKIGKNDDQSPWFTKLRRYTSTLNPGDCLINPPWFWHGIMNLGERNSSDLIVGSPTRYGAGSGTKRPSFKTNLMYSVNAFYNLYLKYGVAAFKPGFKMNLQADIAGNRRDRKEEMENGKELHPFDEAD